MYDYHLPDLKKSFLQVSVADYWICLCLEQVGIWEAPDELSQCWEIQN